MTWGRWVRITLYTVVFAWFGWYGAWALATGVWLAAAVLYPLDLVLAWAAFMEWQTAADYADAVHFHLPTPPTSRGHARLLARRVLRDACRCERWWTSAGTDHDPWCPGQMGRAPRARQHHRARRPDEQEPDR